jgi:hypothetical protein
MLCNAMYTTTKQISNIDTIEEKKKFILKIKSD